MSLAEGKSERVDREDHSRLLKFRLETVFHHNLTMRQNMQTVQMRNDMTADSSSLLGFARSPSAWSIVLFVITLTWFQTESSKPTITPERGIGGASVAASNAYS